MSLSARSHLFIWRLQLASLKRFGLNLNAPQLLWGGVASKNAHLGVASR
jgi:hypothetical protein